MRGTYAYTYVYCWYKFNVFSYYFNVAICVHGCSIDQLILITSMVVLIVEITIKMYGSQSFRTSKIILQQALAESQLKCIGIAAITLYSPVVITLINWCSAPPICTVDCMCI